MQITGLSSASSLYSLLYGPPATSSTSSTPTSSTSQTQSPLASLTMANMDTNGDGVVSESEFMAAMEKAAPAGANMAQVDQFANNLFQKIDTDGSGTISSTELSNFQQKISSAGGGGHHHHHHFKVQDSDSQDSSTSSTDPTQNLVNSLFSAADTNGDGSISKSELTTLLQNYQSTMAAGQSSLLGGSIGTSLLNFAA